MERISGAEVRSVNCGENTEEMGVESLQLGEEIQTLMAVPAPETGSSFTALLELPANQAMELLHSSPATNRTPAPPLPLDDWSNYHRIDHPMPFFGLPSLNCADAFPRNTALRNKASRFSVFAAKNSLETSSIPANSIANSHKVKQEPVDSDSNPNSTDQMEQNDNKKSTKRKEREKKGKGTTKKSKSAANETSDDGEILPYVHVRARRGQATDSHSLAERARREKINARMKLLQELVPGCNKISGTAMVLDEIINHVQSLQRQVEFLSMRLAAVNPRIDFNLDSLLVAESGSSMDNDFQGMVMPLMWPEGQVNGNRQHFQQLCHFDGIPQPVWGKEDNPSFLTPENSLLSYDSSTNLASLPSNQIKMEL
ncbi:hypothetical protein U1Q18_040267 [Sarracenia purpurea var. burkii]